MTPKEIIQRVKELNLPEGEYIVFGSAPICMHGMRECGDIDLFVSPRIYADLQGKGWEGTATETDRILKKEPFETGDNANFGDFHPSLEELLRRADLFDGVPFTSLEDTIAWKKARGWEKDRADIRLIEDFLRK